MNNTFQKNCGIALIVFILLLVFTMLLHPTGGSAEHMIKITKLIVITHSIAILSLPFGWIGFWGLTRTLGTNNFLSLMGFAMMSVALTAVLLAAATNGLVLPIFLQKYRGADTETIERIRDTLSYSFAVNNAFDYIYTAMFSLALLCWSVIIAKTGRFPKWIGWMGILTFISLLVMLISGIAVNSLTGLRLFVGCIVVWIIFIAVQLMRPAVSSP